jgi:DNA-directed RNA polymerase specialized sigma24 family protein
MLDRLSPEQAALARACRDLSAEEVAVRLGIHRGTAYRRLKAIRNRFTELDPASA